MNKNGLIKQQKQVAEPSIPKLQNDRNMIYIKEKANKR
jgi:hypothetical protein